MINKVKTYRYKLRNLSTKQIQKLNSWIGACRFVYNLAVETKQFAYKSYGVSLSRFALDKQLKDLKDIDWIKDVPSQSLQEVIERLDKAYQAFFKGGGYPKWAKKGKYKSIVLKSVQRGSSSGRFVLPKLGEVKTFYSQNIPKNAVLKRATIMKEADGFYISVMVEEPISPLPSKNQAVGIDWGIAHFLTLSTGEQIENPKLWDKYKRELRVAQRSLARKKRGGSNFVKQAKKVARLQAKMARVRKDFQHKWSSYLIQNFDKIAIEDLKVKNMTKSAKGDAEQHGKKVKQKSGLNRSILDTAPASFFEKLAYKSAWYGRELVKVKPHHSSQTCSKCGFVAKENRKSQALFACVSCGHEENADLNASKNIEVRAFASTRQRGALARA